MKIQLIATIKPAYNAETSISLGYLFPAGTEVTIGREIGNTIAPLIDSLSRHHAKLYAKSGGWVVEDLGSTNGSFLNGTKITAPQSITSGAKMQFGSMTITAELIADASATAQIPAPAIADVPPSSLTPAEAAAAGAAAEAAKASSQPTIVRKPTIPGIAPTVDSPGKPVVPEGIKPAPAPAPAPAAPAPAPAVDSVKDLMPVDDIPDLPADDAPTVAVTPAKVPAAPAPAASPLKPGLKLPTKPAIGAGLKLPPKPGLGAGIKLPPKKPVLGAGIKLPPKPGLKLPPK